MLRSVSAPLRLMPQSYRRYKIQPSILKGNAKNLNSSPERIMCEITFDGCGSGGPGFQIIRRKVWQKQGRAAATRSHCSKYVAKPVAPSSLPPASLSPSLPLPRKSWWGRLPAESRGDFRAALGLAPSTFQLSAVRCASSTSFWA